MVWQTSHHRDQREQHHYAKHNIIRAKRVHRSIRFRHTCRHLDNQIEYYLYMIVIIIEI